MKTIVKYFLTMIFVAIILNSCEKDEQAARFSNLSTMNIEEIKSLLFGKWMLVQRGGGFSLRNYTSKDGIYMIIFQDLTREFYDKDTFRFKDTFNLIWDKVSYNNDSTWYILDRGLRMLISDSTSPTGYSTIYITKHMITQLNDSNLTIFYDEVHSDKYKKINNI